MPVKITQLPYSSNSVTIFSQLQSLESCVWLDSGKPDSSMGRYDILSALPSASAKGGMHALTGELNSRLKRSTVHSGLPFCGGWIGYVNYSGEASFSWYDWAVIVDHHNQSTSLITLDTCSSETQIQVLECLRASPKDFPAYQCGAFQKEQTKEEYISAVDKIQQYLQAGDCYQVNYTQRFNACFDGSAMKAYTVLRKAVPSPFSAYIGTNKGAILSISPERFIQIKDQEALTQPIKGTIQRGSTQEQDLKQRERLGASEKDRAENVMIVDLLRNDFNRHCQPHSVTVPKLFDIQSFANVHHLVSTITGTLIKNMTHVEFILSCFPGGSITGAPKKRAMEVISELEPHSRSVYCGSIGYFSCNGQSDFNIAIRTLEVDEKRIFAWAGGGIVLDSEPELEYQESLDKIERLLRAVETAT